MKYYILNSNLKADPSGADEKRMLNEHIASLFYKGQKEDIDKLKDGDVVLLYRNKTGIIACGEVMGKTHSRTYHGEADEEYYKRLTNFMILIPPISASEFSKIIGTKMLFPQAFFNIQKKYGDVVYSAIKQHSIKLKAA